MKRYEIIDCIELIQLKNQDLNKGINESDLDTREDIADLIIELINSNNPDSIVQSRIKNSKTMKTPFKNSPSRLSLFAENFLLLLIYFITVLYLLFHCLVSSIVYIPSQIIQALTQTILSIHQYDNNTKTN